MLRNPDVARGLVPRELSKPTFGQVAKIVQVISGQTLSGRREAQALPRAKQPRGAPMLRALESPAQGPPEFQLEWFARWRDSPAVP